MAINNTLRALCAALALVATPGIAGADWFQVEDACAQTSAQVAAMLDTEPPGYVVLWHDAGDAAARFVALYNAMPPATTYPGDEVWIIGRPANLADVVVAADACVVLVLNHFPHALAIELMERAVRLPGAGI